MVLAGGDWMHSEETCLMIRESKPFMTFQKLRNVFRAWKSRVEYVIFYGVHLMMVIARLYVMMEMKLTHAQDRFLKKVGDFYQVQSSNTSAKKNPWI